MGGADKVKRQHDGGRLTVRDRVEGLVDAGSFHEVGTIAGKAEYDANQDLVALTPANCVFGRARLNNRPSSSAATTSPFAVDRRTLRSGKNHSSPKPWRTSCVYPSCA